MSGKAMQNAAPPVETAFREVTRRIEESEGHVAEFAASLVPGMKALPAPKLVTGVIVLTRAHK